MNEDTIELISEDIERHEGCVAKIYLDSEGLETFGIGHLVTKKDPEYGKPVGTPVSQRRVAQAFSEDLGTAINECIKIFPEIDDYPEPVQRVLVNMTFNLGRPRLSKFKNMIAAVKDHDWDVAADEMIDSRWYRQVKSRGKELVEMMRSAHG
jgi:lysozyme